MKQSITLVGALVATLALSAFASGCASTNSHAAAPTNKSTAPTTTTAANMPDPNAQNIAPTTGQNDLVNVSPNLAVSSAIARACHLEAVRTTPEFQFDSANIVDQDRDLLSALAKCMTDGPLRGKNVELTGRTDPRGESEYNMSLGENRADNVKRYLRNLGIADPRLHATSRGEMDANGTDETSWSHDRRVDIDLVD